MGSSGTLHVVTQINLVRTPVTYLPSGFDPLTKLAWELGPTVLPHSSIMSRDKKINWLNMLFLRK